MAGSSGDGAPSSPRCLWGLAAAYPDSDADDRSPLLSCGSSSERADSLAADDASVPLIPCCADSIAADAAFDAAAESRAADDAAAADVDGRCRVADPVGG